MNYFEDHGLPLVQLKEQRRELVVALAGRSDPIAHAAPPTCPLPRFPPLEVCGRRPPCAPRHHHGAGIRKPSH
jgi:hypothetical protein